jgi:uridine kinase
VVERGRTPKCITEQYDQTVRPMAMAYVRPTEAFADLVVSGVKPLEESTAMALEAVRKKQNAQA